MGSVDAEPPATETYDITVVGAGVAGVNTCYRFQTELPGARFTVLEARDDVGGTWDFFKYPGLRSDSDLHTFGFSWEPWPYDNPIAEAPLIKGYMHNCIEKYNMGRHFQFRHRVTAANWSSKAKRWTLTVECTGADGEVIKVKRIETQWLVQGTGYYDYYTPLEARIPGLDRFQGRVLHPQFWPRDFDHAGQRVAIIGSGATAITLLPTMIKTAAKVTMIQRSPTYIIALPNKEHVPWLVRMLIPAAIISAWFRWKSILIPHCFVLFCKSFPDKAREVIRKKALPHLAKWIDMDPHFKPRYNPWEQRLCMSPDGDFYEAMSRPNAEVRTGTIATVEEKGVRMAPGWSSTLDRAPSAEEKSKKSDLVEADTIITATGLKMNFGGKIAISVDGVPVSRWNKRIMWHGAMVSDLPNFAYMFGYVNASWTLGVDDTGLMLARIMRRMAKENKQVATPRVPGREHSAVLERRAAEAEKKGEKEVEGDVETTPLLQLNSTYVKEGEKAMPRYATFGPWKPRVNPPADWWQARYGDVSEGLELE